MNGVDSPSTGLPAETIADDEGQDSPSRPDDTGDAVSEPSSPEDPDPDDDWVPA